MIDKRVCTLIYIEEGKKASGSPTKIKHLKENVICDERGSFSNKYYTEQDRDMQENNVISIGVHHIENYQNGQLRYVKFDDKVYEVASILSDRRRGKLYRLLDIREYKGVL